MPMTECTGRELKDPSVSWYRRVSAGVERTWARLVSRPALRFTSGWPRSPGWYAAWLAALIAGFIVLAATLDGAAAQGARKLPEWFVRLFAFLTQFGTSGWFLWPLGILLIAIAAVRTDISAMQQRVLAAIAVRAGFLFAAIAVPGLVVTIGKRLIGRGRPFVGGSLDPFLFRPFGWMVEYASMPSGHATNVAAAAVAVGTIWPRARTVAWIYAAAIMASRVVLTAHYPTDVLLGAIAGGVGAVLVRRWFAAKRLGFSIAADGRIVQFPGPSLRRSKAVARDLLAD